MGMTAAVGTVAVGSGISAYSKMQAGTAQQRMFERNAEFARMQATDATARGEANEKLSNRNMEQIIGGQRVSFAAQHIDVNAGSAMDVVADTAYLGKLDAITIKNNAVKEAYGYTVQAADYVQQGKYAKQTATNSAVNTILGAAGNLALAAYKPASTPTTKTPAATADPYYGDSATR